MAVVCDLYGEKVTMISIKRDKLDTPIMRYIDPKTLEVRSEVVYNNAFNYLNIHSMYFTGDVVKFCLRSDKQKMLIKRLHDSQFNREFKYILNDIEMQARKWDQLNKFEQIIGNVELIKDVDKLLIDLQFTSLSFETSKMSEKIGVKINKTWDDVAYKGKLIHLLLKIGYLEYDRSKRIAPSHNESKKFGRHHIFKKG